MPCAKLNARTSVHSCATAAAGCTLGAALALPLVARPLPFVPPVSKQPDDSLLTNRGPALHCPCLTSTAAAATVSSSNNAAVCSGCSSCRWPRECQAVSTAWAAAAASPMARCASAVLHWVLSWRSSASHCTRSWAPAMHSPHHDHECFVNMCIAVSLNPRLNNSVISIQGSTCYWESAGFATMLWSMYSKFPMAPMHAHNAQAFQCHRHTIQDFTSPNQGGGIWPSLNLPQDEDEHLT